VLSLWPDRLAAPPLGKARRGPGSGNGASIIEAVLDRVAAELGADPTAVREANMRPVPGPGGALLLAGEVRGRHAWASGVGCGPALARAGVGVQLGVGRRLQKLCFDRTAWAGSAAWLWDMIEHVRKRGLTSTCCRLSLCLAQGKCTISMACRRDCAQLNWQAAIAVGAIHASSNVAGMWHEAGEEADSYAILLCKTAVCLIVGAFDGFSAILLA
jgi:hypothetical protein